MNDGHELALSQFRSIAAEDPEAFELVDIADKGESLVVDLSIDLRGTPQSPEGIDVRARERFLIVVPSDFPFRPPSVFTRHRRWADAPHVQWGRHLCLYQSPTAEWNPSDGIHGLLSRLLDWITAAAFDALDPVGAPLHPPAVYPGEGTPLVIARADAPPFDGPSWIGFAHIHEHHPRRIDLTGWSELGTTDIDGAVAGVVLLNSPLPHEYPIKLADLIDHLEQSISRNLLYRMLHLTHLYNPAADKILFVVGSPMRGTRGGDLKQHLAVWQVAADTTDMFRMTIPDDDDSDEQRQIRHNLAESLGRWAAHAGVDWCPVAEMRPEITQPRDSGSPLAQWDGKAVEIWGCGAIGSHLAEHLTRAGVRQIVLRDNDIVSPGVLLRQNFDDIDIGELKTHALAQRLRAIRPDLDVVERFGNLTTTPPFAADYTTADALFDTTASPAVTKRLEALHRQHPTNTALVAMLIGHDARTGIATISPTGTSSGPADLLRKTKLACSRPGGAITFADEFWPVEPRTDLFQPEPGCSDPTFTGSDTEVAALTAALLDGVSQHLAADNTHPAVVLTSLASSNEAGTTTTIRFDHDLVLTEALSNYQIRISHEARTQITSWINESDRNRPGAETGGILFGERDDATKICWVSHATGPPPDSTMSPTGFNCGTAGIDDTARALRGRSRDAARPIGMWHTHPDGAPVPSLTDLTGMAQIVTDRDRPLPKQLMIIVGGADASRSIAGYLFDRHKPPQDPIRPQPATFPAPAPPTGRIGLALSGGGSRAIAFHLGVMRSLHDHDLLDHLDVISAVSGGSVIAAMWSWTDEPFTEFDARVTNLLRHGLMGDITRRTLLSANTPRDVISLAAATAASALAVARNIARRARRNKRRPRPRRTEPILRRWVTRTTAFEKVLATRLFGDGRLDQPARQLDVVINACELRSGTAFRFGTRESGSSRYGHLTDNNIPVAHAVAASAAYPIVLPAIDERIEFVGWDGQTRTERVLLTDGGVYDNLGISCLLPGRSRRHSTNVHPVDFIIAADAGHGTLDDDAYPMWWPTRTKRSFEAMYRKTQDAGRTILHDARAAGQLSGFAMPYLGQRDRALPWQPPDLVPRSAVAGYPTNFSKMPDHDVETLARRGEQLTRITIEHHCPDITSTHAPRHRTSPPPTTPPEKT